MPRPAPFAFSVLAACALAACAVQSSFQSSSIPQAPAIEPEVTAAVPHAAGLVSLHGVVLNAKSRRFVLRTRQGRIDVDLKSRTVVRGRLHEGAFAQVVGRGTRPDRARYLAVWQSPPPLLSVSGRITAVSELGFSLEPAGSASQTIVVLSSSTKTPPSLPIGEEVTVVGFGTAARGIVATRVSPEAASPSPSVSATESATPAATATPKPTATPAPTPTPIPTATPTPPRGISLYDGEVVGADGLFSPPDSDSPSGGQTQMVDGIPCAASMSENAYHVHVYLGLYVDGSQVAIPDQIGMYQPAAPSNGYTNYATCFYYIHTHDASGKIHIESPSTAPRSDSLFTLQNVFDVWGMTVDRNGVGPFRGPVRVFVGRAQYQKSIVFPSSYSEYFGDPNAIALYSHEAIWLEIGTYVTPPEINFENEY